MTLLFTIGIFTLIRIWISSYSLPPMQLYQSCISFVQRNKRRLTFRITIRAAGFCSSFVKNLTGWVIHHIVMHGTLTFFLQIQPPSQRDNRLISRQWIPIDPGAESKSVTNELVHYPSSWTKKKSCISSYDGKLSHCQQFSNKFICFWNLFADSVEIISHYLWVSNMSVYIWF